MSWPLTTWTARHFFLQALANAAESGVNPEALDGVLAALRDPRMCLFGGRESQPRSLGSVYACLVTLFLRGELRGIATAGFDVPLTAVAIAVAADSSSLYVLTTRILVYSLHGVLQRTVGSEGAGPLQFSEPAHVSVASDGFVVVADKGNNRVQVLTPRLRFHMVVGSRHLHAPRSVTANSDVIVVGHHGSHGFAVAIFNRVDGVLRGRVRLSEPLASVRPANVCVLSTGHVAIEDSFNSYRVCTVDGRIVRRLHTARFGEPNVARSAFNELIFARAEAHDAVVCSSFDQPVFRFGKHRLYKPRGVATLHNSVFVLGHARVEVFV